MRTPFCEFLALYGTIYGQPFRVKFPDFNGDGKSDIFLYQPSTGSSWTSLSDGSGVFKSFIAASLPPFARTALYGEFDGDNKTDVWFPGGSPGLSTGTGLFVFGPPVIVPGFDVALVADLDGDGKSDVLVYRRGTGGASIGFSTGASFSYIPAYFGPGYDMLRLADFNKDGIPDLLLYERDSPRAFIGLGDGKGNFTFSWIWLSTGYDIIETGDLNGDGAADLVLYNSHGTAHIGLSDGAGGFRFSYWASLSSLCVPVGGVTEIGPLRP